MIYLMLPDDIIIEITKLLTLQEYHRLSLTEKYINQLLHKEVCVQYYLQRHDWCIVKEKGSVEWARFIKKYGYWGCLRQGLQSVIKASTACSHTQDQGPTMEFAWGPTCGNYWKRKKYIPGLDISRSKANENNDEEFMLELDKPLHWFSFRGLTEITLSGDYKIILVCGFREDVILTPLKITIFKDNRPDTEIFSEEWSREQQHSLERDRWHNVVIVDKVYLNRHSKNENEKKYSIRIENTRQYSKGYRIRELRLIPVLEVVEELEETEQQKSDDPYLMDTLHYATT